jgi:hypothetical protein
MLQGTVSRVYCYWRLKWLAICRWIKHCSCKKWSPRKKQIVTFLLCELLVCACLALQTFAFYDVSECHR